MNRTRLIVALIGFFLLQQVAGIANACQMSGAIGSIDTISSMESMHGKYAHHAEHLLNTTSASQTDLSAHQHHQLPQNDNQSIQYDQPANCCDAGSCVMANCHSAGAPLSAALSDWNLVHSPSLSFSSRETLSAYAVSRFRPPIVA